MALEIGAQVHHSLVPLQLPAPLGAASRHCQKCTRHSKTVAVTPVQTFVCVSMFAVFAFVGVVAASCGVHRMTARQTAAQPPRAAGFANRVPAPCTRHQPHMILHCTLPRPFLSPSKPFTLHSWCWCKRWPWKAHLRSSSSPAVLAACAGLLQAYWVWPRWHSTCIRKQFGLIWFLIFTLSGLCALLLLCTCLRCCRFAALPAAYFALLAEQLCFGTLN